jgi:hypothetical protein
MQILKIKYLIFTLNPYLLDEALWKAIPDDYFSQRLKDKFPRKHSRVGHY